MSRNAHAFAATARIERLLGLARRIRDAHDPLGKEAREQLTKTSGLSAQGVERALTQHLETEVSAADLEGLLGSVGAARACHVVLAANVCVAALRALALGFACAPRVFVKPSRRSPGLAPILVRELGDDETVGAATIVAAIDPVRGDEVHVYGQSETLRTIAADLPNGVLFRGHGSGFGVALVDADRDVVRAAHHITEDVVPFDQAGCLSPRVVFVEGSAERAEAFAEALHNALARASTMTPRGPLDAASAAALRLYAETAQSLGSYRPGGDHGVGVDVSPRALLVPPAARVVHVLPTSVKQAETLLRPHIEAITTLGGVPSGSLTRALVALLPHARFARLGAMQRPPLDGPVDRRRGANMGLLS